MTNKFAVPGFARGGGKAVLAIPEGMTPVERRDLLLRYDELVKGLNGQFYSGLDVGTSVDDMDTIATTGAPNIFCRSVAAGGAGSPGRYTALGVFTAIQIACESLFGDTDLGGRHVLVQGAGNVGLDLIERLLDAGAEVSFSDVNEEVIQHLRDERGLAFISPSEVFGTRCDIFAPCALGGILNADTIPRLNCQAVVGCANNQLADPTDAQRLRVREILYAPDYVVNVGGAMAVIGIETMGWSPREAESQVINSVRTALGRIFKLNATERITTDEAARRLAEERLAI